MIILEPIIELVVEYLLKQAIRRGRTTGTRVLKGIHLPRRRYTFASRVALINREQELRAIRAALVEAPSSRVLYLSGPGGIGKTRLLEETERLLRHVHTGIPLRWTGILDLYHTDLHSPSALQTAIIQSLDPDGSYFRNFQAARERYEHKRTQGLVAAMLDAERETLDDLFLQDYNTFTQDHRPVLAIDTLESLSHESDLIQSLCQLEDASTAVHDWLLKNIGRLDNSVLLLAGRPQPTLQSGLERIHGGQPGWLEIVELRGLTREDSRVLLELLLAGRPSAMQALRAHSDRLWQLTAGLPVQLALTVELVARNQNVPIASRTDDITTWGRRLVGTFFCYDDPTGRVLFYLALACKGLTADLLHYLVQHFASP